MSFSFENQGTNTYLVYAVDANESIDSMSLGMLTNNHIPGLAPAIFTQMDTTKFIKYNVTAHISVKQFFSGYVNKKRLIGVFNGIVDAMLSAEDYMIDVNTISLNLDYIFADVTTCETILICLPIENQEQNSVDLGAFFKNIMFSTQFDPTENCDYVAKIINYLNSTPVFSLVDFKNILDGIDKESAPVQKAQPVVSQPVVSQQVNQNNPPVQQKPPQPVQTATQTTQAPPVQQPVVNKPPVVEKPPVAVPPVQNTPSSSATQEKKTEKKMSMFNLMMHYSKENVEIYKAQKAAQKSAESKPVASKPAPTPAKKPVSNTSFAVPGQASQPTNFAVPGQTNPPVNNTPVQSAAPTKKVEAPAAQPQPAVQKPVAQQPAYQPPVVPQSQSMNFGETTVLGGGNIGETTVLGAAPTATQPKPHLIRTKNNEKINLDKPVFRIGKEKSYVDYFIGDNTAISRSHANFISRDGQYFVMDTNSTNHTYVNGAMIQSNVETQLSHGDKVRLANEDFEFKLF